MDGWVDEEALSRQLHVHHKLLRRALKYLEHQQIVAREHLKERSKKKQEALAAATAAAAAALGGAAKQKADQQAADADAPPKLLTFSYCCVDYARFVDSLSLRLHKMRRALRDELDTKEAVATYRCVSCLKDYDSLSAM